MAAKEIANAWNESKNLPRIILKRMPPNKLPIGDIEGGLKEESKK